MMKLSEFCHWSKCTNIQPKKVKKGLKQKEQREIPLLSIVKEIFEKFLPIEKFFIQGK